MIKTKIVMLYLGQIIERDKVKFRSNNLILSPTGSGKTHFILEILANKYAGRKLLLVSTSSLKDSYEDKERIFSSQDLRRAEKGIANQDIHIMTYAEFGHIVSFDYNDDFIKGYSVIYCDEIHSLFDYFFMSESHKLAVAIRLLFKRHDNLDIYYFTATTDKIDKFIDRYSQDLYKNVNIIDYLHNEDIVRHLNEMERSFVDNSELKNIIDEFKDFNLKDKKAIIFNERIDGMENIEELLNCKGYRTISIWSINNNKRPMNDEQLRVRSILLKNEIMPNEYDFVIINGSMREGWNLKDKRAQYVFVNSTDDTNIVQVRGRIRHNITLFAYKVHGKSLPIEQQIIQREKSLGIIASYLGEEITNEDKELISETLDIRVNANNRLVKWSTISKVLLAYGYEIEDKRKRVNGKQVRVSVITLKEDNKKSTNSRASRFLSKIEQTGFTEQNKKALNNYLKKGKTVAFSHIKSSYKNYVLSGDWSERKFTDVTYIIARENKLYTSKFYNEYGNEYELKLTEIDILTERAKYEEAAKGKLEQAQEARDRELLNYIAQNGGK